MNFIFFVFNLPKKRLHVAFSFLWSGKHVFVHSLRLEKAASFVSENRGSWGGFKGALKGGLKGGLKGDLKGASRRGA